MAGVDVPIVPMRHQLRITSPLDGVTADMPIVRITDASGYARPARGGLMFGGFEAAPVPYPDQLPAGFTTDMISYDPGLPDQFAQALLPTIPALDGHTSQEDRGGLFTMTADGKLLAGPVSSVHGFWVTTGCNGSGFSLSSSVGRCVAEWIVGGEPPFDLSLLDPSRFDKQNLTPDLLQQRPSGNTPTTTRREPRADSGIVSGGNRNHVETDGEQSCREVRKPVREGSTHKHPT